MIGPNDPYPGGSADSTDSERYRDILQQRECEAKLHARVRSLNTSGQPGGRGRHNRLGRELNALNFNLLHELQQRGHKAAN